MSHGRAKQIHGVFGLTIGNEQSHFQYEGTCAACSFLRSFSIMLVLDTSPIRTSSESWVGNWEYS